MLLDNIAQHNRTLKLRVPSLGPDALIPLETNAFEAISQSFACCIDCISNDVNIDGHKVLGNHATIVFMDGAGKERYFNGIVHRFESGTLKTNSIRRYQLHLMPQFETFKVRQAIVSFLKT